MALNLYLCISILGLSCFLGATDHHRLPRHLLYYKGGFFKLVIGTVVPCVEDNSIVWAVNLQGNWALPNETTPLWKRDLTLLGNSTQSYVSFNDMQLERLHSSGGRPAIYKALTKILGSKRCMARLICETATGSLSFYNLGVIGQLIQVTLTPGYNSDSMEIIPHRYWRAYYRGRENLCDSYGPCSSLDKIFHLDTTN